jgi:signal transduction histidine kinase
VRAPESTRVKILLIAATAALTLSAHYGWIVEPLFGHVHWFHAIHGRLCYVPIIVAAAWFGIRGGLYVASAISILVLPYVLRNTGDTHEVAAEVAEIVFYFALAILIGALVERELRARREQQEAALKAERSHKLSLVGQIAAGVAHEIKNPLASIKGAAQILVDADTSKEDREEFRDILQNEVRRIDGTVSEFLEFARPKELQLGKTDLSKSVRATVRQLEADAGRQGVSIDAQLRDGIVVNGDSEKLHQMTLNLLLNAVQASRDSDTIRVTLTETESKAQLAIRDSGAGISEEDLDRVLEPFFTTKSSGIGLGLAVVGDIVTSHSGEIAIESTVGQGTTVTVTIPRFAVEETK